MAANASTSKSLFDLLAVDSDSSLDFTDEENENEDTDAFITERLESIREGMTFCWMAILLLLGIGRICASLMIYFSVDLYKVGHFSALYLHNTSVYVVFFAFFVPCLLVATYILALYALIRPQKREPWRLRVAYACFVVDLVLLILAVALRFVTNAFAAFALIIGLPSVWNVLLLRPTRDQLLVAAVILTIFSLSCLLLFGVIALFSFVF